MNDPHASTHTLTTVRADAAALPSLRVVLLAEGAEVSVPLGIDPVVVGTGAECDLVVSDRKVSRRHCSLTLSDKGVVLSDLGSKNGTFVGTLTVREALLGPETIVSVGTQRLTVRVVGVPSVVALSPTPRFGRALGGCVSMRALFARLTQAARTDETILLRGESGTGKELLARAIHDESRRGKRPFVVFDCGAVSPQLIEAELFGSVRGAFTGATDNRDGVLAEVQGGTLFLDEIGELPIDLQPKLLRVLEARQFRPVGGSAWHALDARIVAATHKDLRTALADGTFRSDLYYRVAVIEARVPALRERGEDLDLLVEQILASLTPARALSELPPNTMAMLRSYPFPGNVRELRNVLTRVALFPDLGVDAFESLRPAGSAVAGAADGLAPWLALPLREAREQVVERFEATYLAAKLRDHGGNVARTAQGIGVSRQFLYRLLERYDLRSNDP